MGMVTNAIAFAVFVRYFGAHGAPVRKTKENIRKQKKTIIVRQTQRAQRTQRFFNSLSYVLSVSSVLN